jgi:hypothetical protein
MLDPLSSKLLKDLSEAQKNVAISIMENNSLLAKDQEQFPKNLILEPNGKATVCLPGSNKKRVTTIYEVMNVLQEIMDMANKTMQPSWINNERLIIQRPIINVESESPAVVFKVTDGKPGAAGQGPVNAPSRRMVTPLLLGRYIDPKDDSSEVYVYSQRFDYNIKISIYAKTAHEADIIKEWMADIIKVYLWYVRYSGVLDFTFVNESGDDTESFRHKRSLHYAVSIEKLTWSSFFVLKDFVLNLSTE